MSADPHSMLGAWQSGKSDPLRWIPVTVGPYRVLTTGEPLSIGTWPQVMSFDDMIQVWADAGALPLTPAVSDARWREATSRRLFHNVNSPDGAHLNDPAQNAAFLKSRGPILQSGLTDGDHKESVLVHGMSPNPDEPNSMVFYGARLDSAGTVLQHGIKSEHNARWIEYDSLANGMARQAWKDGQPVDLLDVLAKASELGGPIDPAILARLRRGPLSPPRTSGGPSPAPTPSAPSGDDVPTVKGLREHTSPEFRARVRDIGRKHGISPLSLYLVMAFESGFDPARRNPKSGATGLIQFMPRTAKGLGTTTGELAAMTAEAQLAYVERYFAPWAGKLRTLEDVYMSVLWPSAVGKGRDFVLFSKGSPEYRDNPLDTDKNGNVTVAEATDAVRRMMIAAPVSSLPARILLIGDSLAQCLTGPMASRLGSRVSFAGRGVQSSTIPEWQSRRLVPAMNEADPSITLVSLGTNDAKGGSDGMNAGDLARLILRNGSAVAWILPPTMPFDVAKFSSGVRSSLPSGTRVFDSQSLTIPRGHDGIHPTPQGCAEWADAILAWLGSDTDAPSRAKPSKPRPIASAPREGMSIFAGAVSFSLVGVAIALAHYRNA